ncbi:AAA+ family ATPase [Tabrizicola oligotrophica]|uniref:AAA+ family ATPase n=1 Tax=Tabrizicola oligotrophica TaxID=2710650 RepID=A0A6M0QVJ6_9RHOB|nr:AAA+ family ATPase [Tabrizicola oligotrophica]NEY91449.1 AAA+ family ATPase [Tabrizicola oligotrophica]
MKHLILALALAATGPAMAQTPSENEEVEEGFSLMEEGAKLLLKGLMSEMEPALDEMGKALSEVEPALKDLQPKMLELLALVDDLTNYQAPERLENGDILIRRKPEAPPAPPLPAPPLPESAPEPAPQIDL